MDTNRARVARTRNRRSAPHDLERFLSFSSLASFSRSISSDEISSRARSVFAGGNVHGERLHLDRKAD